MLIIKVPAVIYRIVNLHHISIKTNKICKVNQDIGHPIRLRARCNGCRNHKTGWAWEYNTIVCLIIIVNIIFSWYLKYHLTYDHFFFNVSSPCQTAWPMPKSPWYVHYLVKYRIANCCRHGQNPGWVLINLKSAYQNYPVYQFSCFYH